MKHHTSTDITNRTSTPTGAEVPAGPGFARRLLVGGLVVVGLLAFTGSVAGAQEPADTTAEAVVIMAPPPPGPPVTAPQQPVPPADRRSARPSAPTVVGDAEVLGAQLANTGPASADWMAVVGASLLVGGVALVRTGRRELQRAG